MVFSQRYSDFIDVGHGESKDFICGEVPYNVKKEIGVVLTQFAEPTILRPNRYDNYEINTNVFQIAVDKLNTIVGFTALNFTKNVFDGYDEIDPIGSLFTPWLFDLIELHYTGLSNGEKSDFQLAINYAFQNNEIPWLLCDGRLIKIDAQQFEMDLRKKALDKLHELTDSDPRFQAAYDELIKASEFFEKGNYAEAISNSGKSYESILKVITEITKGNADKLTTEYSKKVLCGLPETMSNEGFREKVLMALPFIRNNSSSDHGAGDKPVIISRSLAKLAINICSALNTFLTEEYTTNIKQK